jgi:hypothetical protein
MKQLLLLSAAFIVLNAGQASAWSELDCINRCKVTAGKDSSGGVAACIAKYQCSQYVGGKPEPARAAARAGSSKASSSSAAGFDGTYNGTRTVTQRLGDPANLHFCGQTRQATFKVNGSSISYGVRSGTIAPNGTFTMSGIINDDRDVENLTGSIGGKSLRGQWTVVGKLVTCGGSFSASRS